MIERGHGETIKAGIKTRMLTDSDCRSSGSNTSRLTLKCFSLLNRTII